MESAITKSHSDRMGLFSNELDNLNTLNIPRQVTCDHLINSANEWVSNLLCAKRKVSSLKSMTMPRLELRAALVLSQLILKVFRFTYIKFDAIHC